MPTQISNQARLTYLSGGEVGSAKSNVASTAIPDSLEAAKISLETSYKANDEITYILSATNNCCCGETALTVTDNLGSFTPQSCTAAVTPLSYVGPALLFIDSVESDALNTSVFADRVMFTVPSLPSGSSAVIIYKVKVNEYADLREGAYIENSASFDYLCTGPKSVSVSHVLPVDSYADVSIIKSMNKDCSCEGMTYRFVICNNGNAEAADMVLTDEFDPAPEITSITVDGRLVPADLYTYTGGVLTLSQTGSGETITVPAAEISYSCDGAQVSPSCLEIVIKGTL